MATVQGHIQGLSTEEARRRLAEYGPNALPEAPPEPLWKKWLRQFRSPLIYILLFALIVDLGIWIYEGMHGWPLESLAIAAILLLNATLGVWQERKAESALEKLKALATPQVWVLRDGRLQRIPATELVPGDMVRIEAGERIPADGVVLQGQGLLVDESVLTGESVPVDKGEGDEVFAGTLAVRGVAYVRITRTGSRSTLGRLAQMLGEIEAEKTPLERRLEAFGHQVARWVIGIAVALVVLGVYFEGLERFAQIFLLAVALAVAAVPEGLPAVMTLTLALGVERMARRKAVVRKLTAVEALGSVTVIATDKTGTLTENRMQVATWEVVDRDRALRAMVLASDAEPDSPAGDPLELALYAFAQKKGVDVAALRRHVPRISERPFDSAWKFMRVTVEEEGRKVSYLKGAPEVLLARSRLSEEEKRHWQEIVERMARQGYRTLALAWGEGETEEDLHWLGVVGFIDPPRPEVPEAVRQAQEAGIRVLMITGDHPATAQAIARQVHIPADRVMTGEELERLDDKALQRAVQEVHVFARVSPEHKLRIVEALKALGEIVAVTGDGVNDAPALKRADVGVAMGQRGSDVTREVADLILLDDNFATIVAAIEEGRNIYENIQKFIRFLFSTNLSEVIVVASGALAAFALDLRRPDGSILLPLTAVQILWINLVTDSLPALALGVDRNPGLMRRGPRPPDSPLLDRISAHFVVVTGAMKAALGLLLLGVLPQWVGLNHPQAQALLFHYMVFAQLAFADPARRVHVEPERNPWLLRALVLGAVIQLLILFLPPLHPVFEVVPLEGWMLAILALSVLAIFALAEAYARWLQRYEAP